MRKYRAYLRFDDAKDDRWIELEAENDDLAYEWAQNAHPTAWIMEIEELDNAS